jgi:hypothetical protein
LTVQVEEGRGNHEISVVGGENCRYHEYPVWREAGLSTISMSWRNCDVSLVDELLYPDVCLLFQLPQPVSDLHREIVTSHYDSVAKARSVAEKGHFVASAADQHLSSHELQDCALCWKLIDL